MFIVLSIKSRFATIACTLALIVARNGANMLVIQHASTDGDKLHCLWLRTEINTYNQSNNISLAI